MKRRLIVRVRRCRHEWGAWWIDDDTGIAERSCLWCSAKQFEQMARHHRVSRLRRRSD